jgi:hypothetical protein
MLRGIRSRLTFGNVTSLVALFVALGGTAYAVVEIDRNSVKSKHILNDQVRSVDIQDDGVTGDDVDEGSLGSVPSAQQANDAQTLDGSDSTDFTQPGSEAWTNGSGWFSTGCSWLNYGNGFSPRGYFRDAAGVVHLRGLVRAVDEQFGPCNFAASAPQRELLYLPAGYLPESRLVLATISNNAPARVDVLPDANAPFADVDGAVAIEADFPTDANAKQWVSLDGLSFRCGPSGVDGCP